MKPHNFKTVSSAVAGAVANTGAAIIGAIALNDKDNAPKGKAVLQNIKKDVDAKVATGKNKAEKVAEIAKDTKKKLGSI